MFASISIYVFVSDKSIFIYYVLSKFLWSKMDLTQNTVLKKNIFIPTESGLWFNRNVSFQDNVANNTLTDVNSLKSLFFFKKAILCQRIKLFIFYYTFITLF